MNKPAIERWVNALESGKYKQGQSSLRTPRGFCCLGVAVDLIDDNWVKERGQFFHQQAGDVMSNYPSVNFMEENYGLHSHEWIEYARRNDDGDSFEQIAQQIRHDLLK
jgi:hypothetical protein